MSLCLCGTTNQLERVTPAPRKSGSERLRQEILYVVRPFSGLGVSEADVSQGKEDELFDAWHRVGRHLLRGLPRTRIREQIQMLIPSLDRERDFSERETVAAVAQRLTLDVLQAALDPGLPEARKRIQALCEEQVSSRLYNGDHRCSARFPRL